MSGFKYQDTVNGVSATITQKFRFLWVWTITYEGRTRRGFNIGTTNAGAVGNVMWAVRTWDGPWRERAYINARAWVSTLADIPLGVYRADKAIFDLGDGKPKP
jgi:hypothetical protein